MSTRLKRELMAGNLGHEVQLDVWLVFERLLSRSSEEKLEDTVREESIEYCRFYKLSILYQIGVCGSEAIVDLLSEEDYGSYTITSIGTATEPWVLARDDN